MTLTLFADLVYLSSTRTADPLAAGIERFKLMTSLEAIRANDGNLSIPLYVRGCAVSEEQGEYATNGLREAVQTRTESSKQLNSKLVQLLELLSRKEN